MDLLNVVLNNGCKCVAVVGMAKNTGKTVTLNRLIGEGDKNGLKLALTSCGRDGESEDVVWHNRKPHIWVPAGTVLTTVRAALDTAVLRYELIEETGSVTPMGQVLIVRALSEGHVQLIGPSVKSQLVKLIERMSGLDHDLLLIDGALDRVASAAPVVADGVIMATGAILAPTPQIVLEQTLARVEQLSVPQLEQGLIAGLGHQKQVCAITQSGELTGMGFSSALGYSRQITEFLRGSSEISGLIIPGAITETTLEAVCRQLERLGRFTLVVEDGTKVFVPAAAWKAYRSNGGEVRSLRTIKVLAVTLNPFSPNSRCFSAPEFLAEGRSLFTGLPVFDPYQLPKI